MSFFTEIFSTLQLGGSTIYVLCLLLILATALIIDKIFVYKKLLNLPNKIYDLIESYSFNWSEFEQELNKLPQNNLYRKFFEVVLQNKKSPLWWLESRMLDEAKTVEKKLNRSLWILETIITVAPLLGLLGTIIGMMSSFKIIGSEGVINPTGVTAGVAEALIATAFGLGIAIIALFAFNFFTQKNDQALDELERLGTRVIDHLKLDKNEN